MQALFGITDSELYILQDTFEEVEHETSAVDISFMVYRFQFTS